MPPIATADAPLSVLSNSTNSSFDGHPRKSHDKTISGVFTYTNGTDVETGLPDHRLDQLKSLRNSSHHSLTNGLPNGVPKGREGTHSKAGSTASNNSLRNSDHFSRTPAPSEPLTKLSNVANASDDYANGSVDGTSQDLAKLKTDNQYGKTEDPISSHTATTISPTDSTRTDIQPLSPTSTRPVQNFSRFATAAGMSPGASLQERRNDSAEMPRLTHRHTLQIPKAPTGASRSSRDFSFSGGPSEEALHTTGRFSPTKDSYDASGLRLRRASLGLVRKTTRSMQSDAHLEELPQDEDAARWTEVIKQKRASRRKRKEEEEDDDRVIVGKKVDEGHVNWVTAYNMLTGIRFTVSRTNAKIDRELTDADFDARHKFSFDITGNELTPSAKYDFKFKDYSPWVFRHLRAIFGLDPADYLMSLTSKYILSELGSPGKSGSFFYFSRDYKYIIKTIHHAEHKLLRKILRDYYKHVVDNPNTLISQFYGLHRVKIPFGRKIHFVVMNNLFPPHRDIHKMFDLKGSTVGRDFKEADLAENPRATLKDLNWLRRGLHLEFDTRTKRIFVEQLQRDVALLQRLHIMDYSLLVGMHDLERGNEDNLREATLKVFQPGGEKDGDDIEATMLTRTPSRLENMRKARELRLTLKKERPVPMGLVSAKMPDSLNSADERKDRFFYGDDGGIRATHEDGRGGETIYYLGVIDCLTHYGFIKRIENFWKGLKDNRSQISPIPPQAYGDRFVNFITGITMTQEEADRRPTHESERTDMLTTGGPSQRNSQTQSLTIGLDGNRSEEIGSPPVSPIAVERTMRKAQKQVDKSTPSEKGRRRSEEEKPDRTLRTTEEPRVNALLPAVSESGENAELESSSVPNLQPAGERFASSVMRSSGIRQVSASTKGEGEDLPSLSHTTTTDQDHVVGDMEELDEKRASLPHRLDSNTIPQLSPLYMSPNAMDPEKTVVGPDGRVLEDITALPGFSMNGTGERTRHTT